MVRQVGQVGQAPSKPAHQRPWMTRQVVHSRHWRGQVPLAPSQAPAHRRRRLWRDVAGRRPRSPGCDHQGTAGLINQLLEGGLYGGLVIRDAAVLGLPSVESVLGWTQRLMRRLSAVTPRPLGRWCAVWPAHVLRYPPCRDGVVEKTQDGRSTGVLVHAGRGAIAYCNDAEPGHLAVLNRASREGFTGQRGTHSLGEPKCRADYSRRESPNSNDAYSK